MEARESSSEKANEVVVTRALCLLPPPMQAVESAEGTKGVSEEFLAIPRLAYADDPMWIPENPKSVAGAFSPRNPWFARGRARTFWILGRARVAGFLDPALAIDGRPAALFGYWESVGDKAADARLFAEVERWARAEGSADLYGPMDFGVFGGYRLRTGAEPGAITFPGEPYNPSWAPARLGELGFCPKQRYTTWIFAPTEALRGVDELSLLRERIGQDGYRLTALDPDWWMDSLPELYRSVKAILDDYFGYAPQSFESFTLAFGGSFIRKVCPRSSVLALAPDGSIAGFIIVYPHYGPIVVAGAGPARVATSALDYDTHLPLLRAAVGLPDFVAYFIGVVPEHRRSGMLFAALVAAAAERAAPHCRNLFGAMSRAEAPVYLVGDRGMQKRSYAVFHKPLAG